MKFLLSTLVGAAVILSGVSSLAYQDGTYSCPNRPGLPENTYVIRTVSQGEGLQVPYLEVTRFYRGDAKTPGSGVVTSKLKGFASSITTSKGAETLVLAAIQLEIERGVVRGCVKQ